jgi:hypothetical protein
MRCLLLRVEQGFTPLDELLALAQYLTDILFERGDFFR